MMVYGLMGTVVMVDGDGPTGPVVMVGGDMPMGPVVMVDCSAVPSPDYRPGVGRGGTAIPFDGVRWRTEEKEEGKKKEEEKEEEQ